MTGPFGRLEPRERLLLGAVMPLAIVAASWTLAYVPLQERRDETRRKIADYRAIAISATGVAARAEATPTTLAPPPAPTRSIAARVTLAAEGAGLPLSRLEPSGTELRVVMQDVAFPALIELLAELETSHGVRLVSIEADRRVEPGVVSVTMTLEDA